MTNNSLSIIKEYILDCTGITLPASNLNPVKDYLMQRWNEKEWNSDSYLMEIKKKGKEYELLLNMITINETYFFREEKHFHFLKEEILPLCRNMENPFKIWSASCSTGEEAISIYSLFLSRFNQNNFKVYASDINTQVLEKFKTGKYRTSSLRNDGKEFHNLLEPLKEEASADKVFLIKNEHINNIKISQINLFSKEVESLPLMDLIFLRNTLIYMDSCNKHKIINALVKKIVPGGILILSSSETPLISHPALKVEKGLHCYYFRKIDPESLTKEKLSIQIRENLQIEKLSENFSSSPPKKNIKNTLGVKEVCQQISLKLNNNLYEGKDTPSWKSSKMILELIYLLENAPLNEPEKMLSTFNKEDHPECLFYFYSGFIPLQKGETEKAYNYFKMALKADYTFWPARYYIISGCKN
ncbi:MAG: CheR family methyltransferase, partial [Spirochaetota bacterium]|nr:CheR family methyltransferase [Spirochaetota bacterium]